MKEMKHCYVFFASPGDVKKERETFPEIIEEVNSLKANSLEIQLVPCTSENALIGWGNPQYIINKEVVKKCDLFVMNLWHRWGSPTGNGYDSGTYEEFCITRERMEKSGGKEPHILLYFRKPDESQVLDPGEQFSKVQDFKKGIEAKKELYFAHYDTVAKWKERLRLDLCKWLDKIPLTSIAPPPISPDAEPKAALESLAKKLVEMEQQVALMQEKERLATTEKERERERASAAEQQKKARALQLAEDAWTDAQKGRLTEAEEKFALALKDYESSYILTLYGLYLSQIGDTKGAEAAHRKALTISLSDKDKEGIAAAYGNLGNVHFTRGDIDKAEEMYGKSLELAREMGNKEIMANQYGNLGVVHAKRGDLVKAEKMYGKSLELAKEVGNKEIMANQYGNLGVVHAKRGDLDKAEKMHEKALQLDRELGSKEGMARDYGNLGIVHCKRGDLATAEQAWEKALNLYKEVGIPNMVAKVEKLLSDLRKPK